MNGDGNWRKERGAEGRVERPETNAGGAAPVGVCPDKPSRTSSSRNSRRRGQKSSICEPPCPEEKAQAEGVKLRPGLLRKRHHLLGRPLESDSHIDDFCPSLPFFRAEWRPPLPETTAARHLPKPAAAFRNRIAFPCEAFPCGASLPTTPCACSPDRPRRIWKTTRGTPRNRRARRQATAGRDRRTSPP